MRRNTAKSASERVQVSTQPRHFPTAPMQQSNDAIYLLPVVAPFTVLYDFEATKEDELTIKAGEHVTFVYGSSDDGSGWSEVVRLRDGATGIVPTNYVGGASEDEPNLQYTSQASAPATLMHGELERFQSHSHVFVCLCELAIFPSFLNLNQIQKTFHLRIWIHESTGCSKSGAAWYSLPDNGYFIFVCLFETERLTIRIVFDILSSFILGRMHQSSTSVISTISMRPGVQLSVLLAVLCGSTGGGMAEAGSPFQIVRPPASTWRRTQCGSSTAAIPPAPARMVRVESQCMYLR